jgi:AraC-like DNA-binding protein
MEKHDIIRENLCVKRILSVIKNHNPKHHKLIRVKDRRSDGLIYVTFGSCTYRFDDGMEFTANAGDVFYLPYQSAYTLYIHTVDYRYIFCDFEFAEAPSAGALFKAPRGADLLFNRLLHLYRSPSQSKYMECMSVLYAIYGLLRQTANPTYLPKSKADLIADAKRFLDENFSSTDLEIARLAEQMGISEVYLRKLFKNRYGTTPLKYLNALRLNNAIALMKHPFLSLEDCALQSGFSSQQYFCRLFKEELGISPGKYRKGI